MKTPSHFVGIDVAKATLEVFCAELALDPQVPNAPAGIRSLCQALRRHRVKVLVICEATGGLELPLFDEALRSEPSSQLLVRPVRRAISFSDWSSRVSSEAAGQVRGNWKLDGRRWSTRLLLLLHDQYPPS